MGAETNLEQRNVFPQRSGRKRGLHQPASCANRQDYPHLQLFFDPLRAAFLTLPIAFADREREIEVHETVAERAIQRFEAHVERVALWTARLGVGQVGIFLGDLIGDGFVEDGASLVGILRLHHEAQAADRVRIEPVHADDVLVGDEGIDPCRFEFALREFGFDQVTEAAYDDQFLGQI